VKKNLLILTNMGPKASAPFQGQFVRNQVDALAALEPDYFFMRWHNDSALNRRLKYPVLWLQFIWQWIFSFKTLDIIHVHYFYPTIWLALTYRWLRNPRVKIVVTCHGSDIYLYKPESALYKFAAAKVDHFIFTSAELRQKFFRHDISAEVLPAGIHPTFGNTKQLQRANKDIDVLFVGTLDFNKGLDRLLALLPQLPSLQIAVVGAGPYRVQLEQAAQQYSNLQLLSPQSPEQLKAQFERSKCFLSLSRNESFGLVMTEAMACYTPVIATDTDGSRAQVRHGQNGYCVSQQDESEILAQLVGAIQRLLSLPAAEYQQLQQQAFADSRQYLVSTVAQRLTALYSELG
jgi:glycosyltransferase involved in cell wall biosynthesis